jgi:hypothetical protein
MTVDVGYFYNEQIRTIVLHTQRLFSNFYISNGKDENGNDELIRVPCVFMSSDKATVSLINNNTDTVIESAPKMVLTISELNLNNNLISGAPYYEMVSDINEKYFNEETGNYENSLGNSYSIYRLNPLPIGIIFKLYILTTMITHKFQLFEQIRLLFSPTAELQTSENPLDWTRISALTLTGVNYSSKGTTNLDSTTLDSMDLTFELNTNLDAPALVKHNNLVETIITEIGEGNHVEDALSWGEGDALRIVHTPTNNFITVQNNNELILSPSDNVKNWYQLIKLYGMRYNLRKNNIYVHCLISYEENKKKAIYGPITIDDSDPTKAYWTFNEELLPSENIKPIDAIIDPHNFTPENKEGVRYLLDDSIANNTKLWGILKDKKGNILDSINENCIIEYINGYWTLSLDPVNMPAVYYVRDLSDAKYLYSYNDEYNIWYDVLNRKYRAGMWRISSI